VGACIIDSCIHDVASCNTVNKISHTVSTYFRLLVPKIILSQLIGSLNLNFIIKYRLITLVNEGL